MLPPEKRPSLIIESVDARDARKIKESRQAIFLRHVNSQSATPNAIQTFFIVALVSNECPLLGSVISSPMLQDHNNPIRPAMPTATPPVMLNPLPNDAAGPLCKEGSLVVVAEGLAASWPAGTTVR